MSNIVQNEISDSRLKKGKEKVEGGPSKKRSKVWDDFVEEEQPDGSKKAKCLHCGDLVCCDTKKHGTNTMRENHFGYGQQRYTEPTDYQENNFEYDPQKNRELFVRMVIDNKSMLEHVENPFLEEFARYLQPLYCHVTRRAVEEDCLTFYKNEKAKLKDEITKLTSRVSLSVESCYNPKLSRQSSSSYCIAAHFINKDFKLVKRIIGIEEFMCYQLFDAERILNDWGLGKKAFAFTTKYDVFIESAKKLNVECILKCFRSIADVFFQIEYPAILSIERMMKDLNEFPEKMCYFNQIASEHNLPTKLEFLLTNEGVLGPYFNILKDACTYKNVFCPLNDMEGGWSEVEEVVHLLNSINDVIVRLSSLEFPTSNLLLNFVFEIRDILSEASPVFPG
ncbi:zinc finger BED domain-containing protein RICESLEEPER 4-like [Carex rostrata]